MVKAGQKRIQKDGRELQGIGFMVAIRPGDSVETEFALMVDTLYKWYEKFGEACEEFTVGFVGLPEHHEACMTYLLSLIQQEEPLHPMFARLGQVSATFVSRDGKVLKETKLKIGADD
jgi:hypothetical protein